MLEIPPRPARTPAPKEARILLATLDAIEQT